MSAETQGSETEHLNATTSDEIYTWLRDQIVDGTLKVGDRIPSEMELCERWQTSRGTVRQALERLILLGIIIKVRGSGSFVSDASSRLLQDPLLLSILFKDQDLLELLLFRRTLDVGSARLCAENRNESDMIELNAIFNIMQEEKNGPRYAEADMAFHMTIAQGTRNAIHLRFYQMLQLVLKHQIQELNFVLGASTSLEDHHRILSAIEEQDATLAGYFMERHLNRTINELKAVRKQNGKEQIDTILRTGYHDEVFDLRPF